MFEFHPDSKIQWNELTKKWDLHLKQSPASEANAGVPAHPYVYRVFITLDLLEDIIHATYMASDSSGRASIVSEKLLEYSIFSRVASRADSKDINSLSELSESIVSSIDPAYYSNIHYTNTDSSGVEDSTTPSNYFYLDGMSLKPFRSDSTSHKSISGWYTFIHTDLKYSYTSFDKARETKEYVKYYLNSYLISASESTLPLSAGITSISPSRTFSERSLSAEEVFVGDTIRINVSGGSGTHTVTNSGPLERLTKYKWKVIAQDAVVPLVASVATLVITDTEINSTLTITINISVPSDPLLDNTQVGS